MTIGSAHCPLLNGSLVVPERQDESGIPPFCKHCARGKKR
jgi:hypothetical protein